MGLAQGLWAIPRPSVLVRVISVLVVDVFRVSVILSPFGLLQVHCNGHVKLPLFHGFAQLSVRIHATLLLGRIHLVGAVLHPVLSVHILRSGLLVCSPVLVHLLLVGSVQGVLVLVAHAVAASRARVHMIFREVLAAGLTFWALIPGGVVIVLKIVVILLVLGVHRILPLVLLLVLLHIVGLLLGLSRLVFHFFVLILILGVLLITQLRQVSQSILAPLLLAIIACISLFRLHWLRLRSFLPIILRFLVWLLLHLPLSFSLVSTFLFFPLLVLTVAILLLLQLLVHVQAMVLVRLHVVDLLISFFLVRALLLLLLGILLLLGLLLVLIVSVLSGHHVICQATNSIPVLFLLLVLALFILVVPETLVRRIKSLIHVSNLLIQVLLLLSLLLVVLAIAFVF
mmetsp:Transcript_5335/g.16098  ORF Transcript_5335/g.16098 Transcript_5335/m.16098 type:complete len:399 (-) Transcript_5335:364-1560(-)